MKFHFRYLIFAIIILGLIILFPSNNCEKLDVVGSTSVQPICEDLIETYSKSHNIDINIQGGGSSLAVRCTNLSIADIGMCSKEINDSSLNSYLLGYDGIAVIVNKENPLSDLSDNELKRIFSGNISKWDDGSKINVIVREEGSGTLDAFKTNIMNGTLIKDDAIVQNSAGSVKQAVMNDRNAIGFVSLTHLDSSIKNISIGGVTSYPENILDGKYPLRRPFLLLTNKTPSKQTLDFIDWTKSNEAKNILKNQNIVVGD